MQVHVEYTNLFAAAVIEANRTTAGGNAMKNRTAGMGMVHIACPGA